MNDMTDEKVIVFGEHDQWAISADDGCLLFHPQWATAPEKKATHIWPRAYEEVERRGGLRAVYKQLTGYESNA